MIRLLSALALSTTVALCGCNKKDETAEVGQEAPAIAALNDDSEPVDLADYRGKVVLVNFWRAECGPCLREMPEHDKVYQRLKKDGFEILAVNVGQSQKVIHDAQRRIGVSFPLLSDELEITSRRYRVIAVPTSVILDREGIVRAWKPGPMTEDELEEKVEALL
ncbi:TlpA family protein disulfide reductase [Afifella sp. H1R]|uniref:TlpA family protein disulfide reductase n=1 Tax=Afifella sp. H1R TaxID=2908841 RepID=UPI001F1ED2DA|nr:TlpA disulfide reductase family protein [Afifella sp. H1R]MCF1503648.1 TlpA family protein disulfide reductase [Afifella sp. H1R]